MIPRLCARLSGFGTMGKSDFFAVAMMTTMNRIVAPRRVFTTFGFSARPIIAPPIAAADAISATGIASRRLARFLLSRPGPAASAPASATRRPAPLTKSMLNGKNPPTIGTNSTPPPTPPSTARMPRMNVVTNNASGHTHQGVVDSGTTETGPGATAWASPCPAASIGAGADGAGSFDANTVPAAASMVRATSSMTKTLK